MKLMHKWIAIAAFLTLAAGVRAQDAVPPAGPQSAAAGTAPDYRLSPNDLIFVKVFQEDDLDSTLRVAEDGSIIFPLIGSVKVGGRSVASATGVIRDLLDARFLVNPQVTLTVLAYANRHITVLGQVQRPGDYNLREQGSVSLLEAIGISGDIIVKRAEGGAERILHLNAKTMASDNHSGPFVVFPGDTITVTERFF